MKLYLVQHGLALSKDVDPGRPLDPHGEDEVRRIAEFLRQSGIIVDRIVHSGKVRAHQTADIFAEGLLVNGESEAINGIAPKDSVSEFAQTLSRLKHDTMVVGHLPFMAKLVSLLVTGKEEPIIVTYKPGSVVCLELDKEMRWHIQWMLRPGMI